MRAFKFRLLKPPRARLAAVMMVVTMMIPAHIHSQGTVAKMRSLVKSVPRAIEARRGTYFFRLLLFVFFQPQGGGADAEAQARRLRAIRVYVPEMRFATRAHSFSVHHSGDLIGLS